MYVTLGDTLSALARICTDKSDSRARVYAETALHDLRMTYKKTVLIRIPIGKKTRQVSLFFAEAYYETLRKRVPADTKERLAIEAAIHKGRRTPLLLDDDLADPATIRTWKLLLRVNSVPPMTKMLT